PARHGHRGPGADKDRGAREGGADPVALGGGRQMITYFNDHRDLIGGFLETHARLAGLPLLFGLLIALPLGWLARRYRFAYPPLIGLAGLLYTIPSIALFV